MQQLGKLAGNKKDRVSGAVTNILHENYVRSSIIWYNLVVISYVLKTWRFLSCVAWTSVKTGLVYFRSQDKGSQTVLDRPCIKAHVFFSDSHKLLIKSL